jgi:pimeloyl-ACP methyl ester carboxylesterase
VAAISWRGTGGTPAPPGVTKIRIGQHVDDLRRVLTVLPSLVFQRGDGDDDAGEPDQQPDVLNGYEGGVVLVSHSFGGLTVMKLLEEYPELLTGTGSSNNNNNRNGTSSNGSNVPCTRIRGIVSLCSVPPSGNVPMTLRYLRRSLKWSYRITVGFALKRCCNDPDLCKDLFFGGREEEGQQQPEAGACTVSDEDVARYQSYFRRDSEATIDLADLSRRLPSARIVDKAAGRAPYASSLPPCLVVGAVRDRIVDREGVRETARYFAVEGSEDEVMVDSPHDVMLGREWRNAARTVEAWLARQGL